MKFAAGLVGVAPRHFAAIAQSLERNGFSTVYAPDHVFFPEHVADIYPGTEDHKLPFPTKTALYDPWVSLAYIAATTTTIRLGTFVYILPLRHPLLTARTVLTLDRLSGGRVNLGVGVGWLEDEYEALGRPFNRRGRDMDEIIPLLRRLWSEETISHEGAGFSFAPLHFEPKPYQGANLPIEVGGTSAAALRRAGTLGDGYITEAPGIRTDLADIIATIHEHRRAAGRDQQPYEVSGPVGNDLDTIKRAEEIGVTQAIVLLRDVEPKSAEAYDDYIKRFADEVISSI